MTRPMLLTLAAAVICALCTTTSAQDSTGTVVLGFRVVSNVTGYMAMARDACDITAFAMANPVNLTEISSIYRNGRNSVRTDGRNRRTLRGWTMGAHATAHPYYENGTAMFGEDWIGSVMEMAVAPGGILSDRQKGIMATNLARLQLPLSYMLAELSGIADEINPNGTNVTASGAPHALDEGFGVYVGQVQDCAPWAYAEEAAAAFGTLASCDRSQVNTALIADFNRAQAATISGNVSQFEQARDNIVRGVQVSLVQNVLMRAKWVQDAWRNMTIAEQTAAALVESLFEPATLTEENYYGALDAEAALGNATDAYMTAKADAYVLYRALGPFIHMYSPVAHSLDIHFGLSAPVSGNYYTTVLYALQTLYSSWGITNDMVGSYGATSEACPSRTR